MSKYQEQHYEDVARTLRDYWGRAFNSGRVPRGEARAFADLFYNDNPPGCSVGSHDGPCTPACRIDGFDRERFLKACGLES